MTRTRRRAAGATGAALLTLVVTLLVGSFVGSDSGDDANAGTVSTTTTVVETCNKADVVTAVLVSARFTPDQFTVGEDFDLSLPAALEAGNGRFTDEPPTTKPALMSLLGSSDPAAQALLNGTVAQSGGIHEQALDPGNWTGFQLLVPSDWSGNTLWADGQVTPAGTRHSAKGDIGWVFVNPDDCRTQANVVRVAIVRMGCGNPQLVPPSPPGMPVPPPQRPPTTTTTRPGTTTSTPPPPPPPTTTTTVCPTKGCTGATVTVQPTPPTTAPTTTTAPPNNGGQGDSGDGSTNTTNPPTTVAPAPAPPTTATPTTNPPPPPG